MANPKPLAHSHPRSAKVTFHPELNEAAHAAGDERLGSVKGLESSVVA